MSHKHFTDSERFELYQLRTTTHLSLRAIAQRMNCSQSSLSREIKRNQFQDGSYLPNTAQAKAEQRRREAKPKR
ncbi:helix-turn-helix domain-containing protein [Neosynechococcus sphagnicola]|uniref:helix-turn-helix domain-containing protein n=1 Tax=Neosynechococcus sphagnicola TaxID=1501145 RepID=UPI0009077D6C|nr:helix-turn-helix domain-containing protein [Neosynechococcus sphagnicola]